MKVLCIYWNDGKIENHKNSCLTPPGTNSVCQLIFHISLSTCVLAVQSDLSYRKINTERLKLSISAYYRVFGLILSVSGSISLFIQGLTNFRFNFVVLKMDKIIHTKDLRFQPSNEILNYFAVENIF
ncbi:hypothetical protein RF11_00731 [Thelohanellus kitauei]|uniref:Uncharacterized protein n=1 Tax=Thelohanellus kitauei TaxID=669202 RepID=A0A0C2NKZ3_THEKT|nr:hypothetical protein RF11_00731 [Thelohanellus kitauei]